MIKKILLTATLTLLFVGIYSVSNRSAIPVVHAVSYGSACVKAEANCAAGDKALDVLHINDYEGFVNKTWCDFFMSNGLSRGDWSGGCDSINNFYDYIDVSKTIDRLGIDVSSYAGQILSGRTLWNDKIKPLLLCQSKNVDIFDRRACVYDWNTYVSGKDKFDATSIISTSNCNQFSGTTELYCDSSKGFIFVETYGAQGCCPSNLPIPVIKTGALGIGNDAIGNQKNEFCCPSGATHVKDHNGNVGCYNGDDVIIGDGVFAWSGDKVSSNFSANVQSNSLVYLPKDRSKSDYICNPKGKATCAQVSNTGKDLAAAQPQPSIPGLTGTNNTGSVIVSPSSLAGYSLNCEKCYEAGDVIYTNTNNQKMYTCNADGTVKESALIAGSSSITAGYLISDAANQEAYKACFDSGGIWTAIGCVDPTPIGILTGIIRIAFGVMGGVALLQLIYAGIMYQMGNEEKIKEARKMVTATILGIVVLVFSVVILRVIGINVLDILPSGSV